MIIPSTSFQTITDATTTITNKNNTKKNIISPKVTSQKLSTSSSLPSRMTDSPHTPINLINSNPTSNSTSIYNQLLKSPLNFDSNIDEQDENHHLLPFEQPFDQSPSSNSENVEIMISNLMIVLEDPQKDVNKQQIKTILQKCLITISHYKLQNEILRFENNEVNKRKDVENDLIKRQVDYLLKSPFKPSDESSITHEETTVQPKRQRRSSSRVKKPTTGAKNLKLVEKFNNHPDKLNEFNNCIKVFHLEKN